jgi:excinuclease ABC subunit C
MTEPQSDKLTEIREKIKAFPQTPGLYFMKDANDVVLYIGKAKSLRSRVASYFQPSSDLMGSRGPKIVEMISKVATVDYLEAKSEIDAILKEARLIKDIRPPYNTALADDKTFPYMEITTSEDYPGVYITREPKEHGTKLFGPFAGGAKDLQGALVLLQKIFKFRTCTLEISEDDPKRRFFRPCILYSINQCTAPCGARVQRPDYLNIIKDLVKFLQSKRSVIMRQLNEEMQQASENFEYERAGMLRDRIRLIERLDDRGSLDENVQPEAFAADPAEALTQLRMVLKLDKPVRIIEGFDIANISGQEAVGSLVKFIDGRPFKSGYRRFRIKTVQGIDDYAMMREVITRRYKYARQGEELWPDLVLIDGGIGHLHAVQEAFKIMEVTPPHLASIAKKEEEIFVPGNEKPLRLASRAPARKLLQYVRDEAHRFAQHYHHILRSKKMLGEE